MKVKIYLNAVDKVKKFVEISSNFDGDIDVVSGRYIVDGKSVMGLLSLDLTKKLELHLYELKSGEIDKFLSQLKEENLM